MRILIDAVSARSGGGWTYLVNLVRELQRDCRGMSFRILVRADGASELRGGAGLEIVPVKAGSAWQRVLFEELVLPVRARGFDALYCVADLSPPFAPVPTVVALRNLNIYDHRFYDTPRLRWLRRAAGLGAGRARRVLFPSRAAAQTIGSILQIPEERTGVVPHGIDASGFAVEREPEPFLLVPSAVERHKNLEVVVEALAHLDPGLEVRVAGTDQTDPDYVERLRDIAERRGVGERLRFLGGVPYHDMIDLYRRCSAVVVPSWIETFGHPLLEAMAVGAPLLVSDLEVFREVAGDVAWRFPPDDPAALALAVGSALDPAEAERRARAGRARVDRFTWKASVDALCVELRQVAEGYAR